VTTPNAKVSLEGGQYDDDGAALALGSYTIPLGHSFGLQADGALGNIADNMMGGGGVHLFTRDPSTYLLGVYGSYHTWDSIDIWRLAGEFQLYLDRYSLDGLAGYEGVRLPATNGALVLLDPNDDHFFGQVDLSFYPVPDLRLYGGYRYVNETSLAGAGIEYLMRGVAPVSAFAKADFGDQQYNRITAGLRIYLNGDKSLIDRHRTEDPENYTPMFPRLDMAASTPVCTVNSTMTVVSPANGQCLCPPGTFQPGQGPTPFNGTFVCYTPN
jgi:hypothetical protein